MNGTKFTKIPLLKRAALKTAPSTTFWNASPAHNFSAFKLAHPECNVFVSLNSYAGLGVASFIEENDLKGELYAFGIDDSEEILQAVKDGNLSGSLSQGFYNIGYKGVYVAKQVLDGEAHEWHISSNPEMVWPAMADDWAAKLGYSLK